MERNSRRRRPLVAVVALTLVAALVVAAAPKAPDNRTLAAATVDPAFVVHGDTAATTADAAPPLTPATPGAFWQGIAAGAAGGFGWAIGEYIISNVLSLFRGIAAEDPVLSDQDIDDLLGEYDQAAA